MNLTKSPIKQSELSANLASCLDLQKFPVALEGLFGSARALFLAHLRKRSDSPIMVITRDQISGESLLNDLLYFAEHEKFAGIPRFFPTWELLPYEYLSPLAEIAGERLEILNLLLDNRCPVLITPVEAVMQFVMPRETLRKLTFLLRKGDTVERDFIEACLVDNGYTRTTLVEGRGEFSLRGDIFDVFPPSCANPIRVEFFGDVVESLRAFDVSSQISLEDIREMQILPVREICLSQKEKEDGIERVIAFGNKHEFDRHHLQERIDQIQNLGDFPGIEMLAPFFYPKMETLFDYLPQDILIVVDEKNLVQEKCKNYHETIQSEYDRALARQDASPAPESFYVHPDELNRKIEGHKHVYMSSLKKSDASAGEVIHFDVKPSPLLHGKFDVFAEHVMKWQEEGLCVIVTAPTRGQVKRVHDLLNSFNLEVDVDLGQISSGFMFPALKKVFVAEHEIFGKSHKHRYRRKQKSLSFQRGFKDLKPGDYLVHIDYGIGKYIGARELKTSLGGGEFLEIHYADDEKLYIPMDGLALIQKYVGSNESPPLLSKMGTVAWKRQREKIKESIREMAEELLKLYAVRELAQEKRLPSNPVLFQEFADSFEYDETEDQLKAIEEVYEDLEKPKPMDRLVCGDVGYGKTEVAMRAAFKVVMEKGQVALLVPTTILAQQHLNTFRERFRAYPVNIDMVNRFRSPKEQKEILAKLKAGTLDIIIGTHRLLSSDVKFANLKLIIIDEEQRFGVKHKEKLKQLRSTVDMLTLTATPIPRTLHFSLMGIRDLSVIETPPNDRLAIKTFLRKFDEEIIREAIMREVDRGGQIYFVHNKIKSIHSLAAMLNRIVPEVKIGIAHGQLHEHMLEKVMRQFVEKEIDLLLCTSIVESGLDIPSANTIIINRADQFGLAQLYQLRGRVGRYKHQAYAYLLIPGTMTVSEEARKRLHAIEEMSELGAGFQLASRDMEIRGTGNMLGHNQSGHINSIGFDLYCKLIDDTVKELRGVKVDPGIEPEIDLQTKGFIPKDYITDLNQRLEIYRRLMLVGDIESLDDIQGEIVDRYGQLPEPVEKLILLIRVKIICRKLHFSKVISRNDVVYFNIEPSTPISTEKMMALFDNKFKLASEYKIEIKIDRKGWKVDMSMVMSYLEKLLDICNVPK